MGINMKKILTIGLAAALATTMSIGFADSDDDDDDKGSRNEYKHKVVKALEPSVDTKENIVVSLATNPLENHEPACVALLIATNLLMDDLNRDGEPDATAADSVTLFATLDGVELVNSNNDLSEKECVVNTAGVKLPLTGVRFNFLANGGEILVCPLCMVERGLTEDDLIETEIEPYEDQVNEANAFDIHDLFLYADKILTF